MCEVRRTQREVWMQTRETQRGHPWAWEKVPGMLGKMLNHSATWRKPLSCFWSQGDGYSNYTFSFIPVFPPYCHAPSPPPPTHAPIKQVNIPRCQFADWYGGTPGERFWGGVAICIPAPPKSSLPAAVDWDPEAELPTIVLRQDQLLSLWWPCKEQC